ncbi:MAG TPA: transglycosylase domain-containing protein [Acidimicrobiales bacterium]|nr:transglycosylase domain-containing protein [Acidimicrobiales bacterium]
MESPILARLALAQLVFSALAPVVVVGVVLISFATLPVPDRLPPAKPPGGGQISRIYDATGQEIGQFSEFEQNRPVRPEDIPLILKQAVVSAEDKNFYRHGGVDMAAAVRAMIADARGQEIVQGGSTITQQLVKNAYTGGERTFSRKVREGILARQLSRKKNKDQILFQYLSSIYLGNGAYGVGAASEAYFRKPVNELTLSEAALLAGLIPAPSRYEPRANPGAAEVKRVLVLDRMREQGYITQEQRDQAVALPVRLASGNVPLSRSATYVYPARQVATKYPYFVDYARRWLESKLGRDAVYRGGLEIHTTLDPRLQAAAEASVTASLEGVDRDIEMALVSLEPGTGYVRAMVGGRDFLAPGGQVNLALGKCPAQRADLKDKIDVPATCWDKGAVSVEGGGSGRQPGSSWKPFVLATAFAKGIPDTKVYSAPSVYHIPHCTGADCTIQNYEGESGGRATLREATEHSYNTVFAQVINEVGVPQVAEMAKKLGITSAWVANPEVQGPSYALGVQEVSPLDMASAYSVFATGGIRNDATPILYIEKPDGKIIDDNRQPHGRRVVAQVIADNVTDVLKGVILRGTGTKADIGRPAAGKTGTAQEWRDAWFIGYTPQLSTSVWIGNKLKPTPLLDIKNYPRVFGGSIPAETWKAYMTEALKDVPPTDFEVPAPLESTSTTLFAPPTVTTVPYTEPTTTTLDTTPPTTLEEPTTLPSSSTTSTTRVCGLLLPRC